MIKFWLRPYHIERPVLVDHHSLSDGSAIHVDDPEQRRKTRSCSHLARQSYVLVAEVRHRRSTANYWTVCIYRSITVDQLSY